MLKHLNLRLVIVPNLDLPNSAGVVEQKRAVLENFSQYDIHVCSPFLVVMIDRLSEL